MMWIQDDNRMDATRSRGGVAASERVRCPATLITIAAAAVGWAAAAALFFAVLLGLPRTDPEETTANLPGSELTEEYSMYVSSLYDFEDF